MLTTLSDYYRCARSLLAALLLLIAPTTQSATVLVLGDSLSAGYGLSDPSDGWVNLLAQKLPKHTVINASISGDTLSGGLSRLPQLLEAHSPAVVLIELGGNDGLRGFSLVRIRSQLQQLVQTAKHGGARVLVMEMRIPPNYGQRYTSRFSALYAEVATAEAVELVPFFLQDLALQSGMMQADGIHPTAAAQPAMRDAVASALMPLLAELADN